MTDPAPQDTPAPAPPPVLRPSAATHCANCGVALEGKYCHACGQPIKGMIRPLSGLTADVVDSVFNLDSRILRTLGPLYFKPGFLTTEYFIGRRQRYVTPFRLFFFLTIVGFFLAQIYLGQLDFGTSPLVDVDKPLVQLEGLGIEKAKTAEDVVRQRDEIIEGFKEALAEPDLPVFVRNNLEAQIKRVNRAADRRLAQLSGTPAGPGKPADSAQPVNDADAAASGTTPPATTPPATSPPATTPPGANPPEAAVPAVPPGADAPVVPRPPGAPLVSEPEINFMQFNDKAWNAKTNPLRIEWLPDIANAKINEMIGNGEVNFKRALKEPKRFVALIGVLPQSLFLIMPLFAVLLKIFFIFKRRYYMEHLMVALHSHAFISLSILLFCLVSLAELAWPATTPVLFWVNVAIGAWIPLYLLIMQKRVYRQNWFMTVLKWGLIGFCYIMLISTAVAIAAVVGLMLQ